MLIARPHTLTATAPTGTAQQTEAPQGEALGRILECTDLSVDACVVDEITHDLIFLSVWGRDTAIQELLARLTLEASAAESLQSGITLHLASQSEQVFLRDTESLEKRLSRAYRGTLFGSLLHLWLFHPQCIKPNRGQHRTYVLLQGDGLYGKIGGVPAAEGESGSLLWPLAVRQTLCRALLSLMPFPILPEWAQTALDIAQHGQMLRMKRTLLGDLACFELHLDIERLEAVIGQMIRCRQLVAN